MRHAKRIVTSLASATVVTLAVLFVPVTWIVPVVAALCLCAIVEYAQLVARRTPLGSSGGFVRLIGGILLLVASLAVLPLIAAWHGNAMLLYVLAIVKVSDMGGFALGVSCGRHKLCPTVSPNKTWEGLLGSVIAAVIVSVALVPAIHFSLARAVLLGVIAALLGTVGDLAESRVKRWAGVKDSATFMPAGLGGFLDMIDSLLFAPAVLLPFL